MSKDKRIEEKEKLEAELERSLAVIKVKEAHRQIEETEKLRKHSAALSICKRIDLFIMNLTPILNILIKPEYQDIKLSESETAASSVENSERTYVSIRYDFQKNLDIGDEGMTKMFPMIAVRKDSLDHSTDDLSHARLQIQQMKAYCERLIS